MILVLLVAIVSFNNIVLPADIAAKSQWPRSKILNANSGFIFSWNPQPDEDGFFHFSLKAHTHGYIGFGLSDTGTMAGADLLIAWPIVAANNTSRITIMDLYAAQNGLPSVDALANWQLVSGTWTSDFPGSHNGGGIIEIHVTRLVDTKDPEDLPIAMQGMHVLYAWGNGREVEYHSGGQRGAVWTKLLDLSDSSTADMQYLSSMSLFVNFALFVFSLMPLV